MNAILLVIIVLIGIIYSADSFSFKSSVHIKVRSSASLHNSRIEHLRISRSLQESSTALFHSKDSANKDDPYLQHECPSCSYVFDEEKGFKKRIPPGNKYSSEDILHLQSLAGRFPTTYKLQFRILFMHIFSMEREKLEDWFSLYKSDSYNRRIHPNSF